MITLEKQKELHARALTPLAIYEKVRAMSQYFIDNSEFKKEEALAPIIRPISPIRPKNRLDFIRNYCHSNEARTRYLTEEDLSRKVSCPKEINIFLTNLTYALIEARDTLVQENNDINAAPLREVRTNLIFEINKFNIEMGIKLNVRHPSQEHPSGIIAYGTKKDDRIRHYCAEFISLIDKLEDLRLPEKRPIGFHQ